jgi:small subunit ribosomal protein S20
VANHKSAQKRARQNVVKNARNRSYLSSVRTALKKFRTAVASGSADTQSVENLFKSAQKSFDMAAAKGLLHKNNAARNISRMTKTLRAFLAKGESTTAAAAAKPAKKSTGTKKAPAAKKTAAKAGSKPAAKKSSKKK